MKRQLRVLSLGAVLWDVIGENEYIGGAPFNFAVNMRRLGAESALVTSVGNDERGRRAKEKITDYGVSSLFVQTSETQRTGVAMATVGENGNARYEIPYAAFDEIAANDRAIRAMNDYAPDIVYFGTFEQRHAVTREAVCKILEKVRSRHVFFDVNLRMNFVDENVLRSGLNTCTVLKLNHEEREIISELFYKEPSDNETFAKRVAEEFGIQCVIVTLGAEGCVVYENGRFYYSAPPATQVADTIGAGDAFSSAFLFFYSQGVSCRIAAEKGNELGAYVAGKNGALPDFDETIKTKMNIERGI